jgi:hypothetical protein
MRDAPSPATLDGSQLGSSARALIGNRILEQANGLLGTTLDGA